MRKLVCISLILIALTASALAQATSTTPSTAPQTSAEEKPKRVIFRATKDQITQVQTMLKQKGMYGGEATGKLDDDTRASIKSWQKENGLKATGTLNRATLEKMGIELTERQKAIPASESSYDASTTKDQKGSKSAVKTESASMTAGADDTASTESKPKRTIFRATKDQINAAQKVLKDNGMYTGDETGKLDDATREGLKKYQAGNGLKVTGTLNQVTLEKMGIELTEKQKADSQSQDQ
jgi:peptidoglycan hydrolase-like protein with peptidoglycan-binding domain